jgi:predicted  nucleic acid-binding Zn-ribbon protein
MRVLLLAASIAASSGACARSGSDGPVSLRQDPPEAALDAFFTDLRFQRVDRAYAALAHRSRTWLEERHRRLQRAATPADQPSDDASIDRHELLYRTLDLTLLSPPESIVVVSPPGDRVTLRVTVEGGASAEVVMVREDGRWKVDLESTLGAG